MITSFLTTRINANGLIFYKEKIEVRERNPFLSTKYGSEGKKINISHSFNFRSINLIKPENSSLKVFGPGGGFLGVGSSELLVIGIVAWLVLGPKRLYQLAKDIGKITSEVKNVADEARQTFQQAIEIESVSDQTNLKETNEKKEKKTNSQKSMGKVNIDELFDNETKNF